MARIGGDGATLVRLSEALSASRARPRPAPHPFAGLAAFPGARPARAEDLGDEPP